MSQGSEATENVVKSNENNACNVHADSVKASEELIRRLLNEALAARRNLIRALKDQERLIDELKAEQLKF